MNLKDTVVSASLSQTISVNAKERQKSGSNSPLKDRSPRVVENENISLLEEKSAAINPQIACDAKSNSTRRVTFTYSDSADLSSSSQIPNNTPIKGDRIFTFTAINDNATIPSHSKDNFTPATDISASELYVDRDVACQRESRYKTRAIVSGLKYLNLDTTDIDDFSSPSRRSPVPHPAVAASTSTRKSFNGMSENMSDVVNTVVVASESTEHIEPSTDVNSGMLISMDSVDSRDSTKSMSHNPQTVELADRIVALNSRNISPRKPRQNKASQRSSYGESSRPTSLHRRNNEGSPVDDYVNTVVVSAHGTPRATAGTPRQSTLKQNYREVPMYMRPHNPKEIIRNVTKVPPIVESVSISLEEIYSGVKKIIDLEIAFICETCMGCGYHRKSHKCDICGGQSRTTYRSFVEKEWIEEDVLCSACCGLGCSVDQTQPCETCHGNKQIFDTVSFVLKIPKGVKDGTSIVFENMGDQQCGYENGDVVFSLKRVEHPIFQRNGNDLITNMCITIFEALAGFCREITLLSGEKILIASENGEVYEPNSCKMIQEAGMPVYDREDTYGNLYIIFEVIFPKFLSRDRRSIIIDAFSDQFYSSNADNVDTVSLSSAEQK